MKTFLRILATAAIILFTTTAAAQVATLPVKTINGKQYYYYEVQPKETLYSLQHKLGIDRETIEKYNPSVQDGLQAHKTLYFPVAEVTPSAKVATQRVADTSKKGTVTHDVKKGESIYGIAKSYATTVDELMRLNPSLKDGLKAGETIIISREQATANTPQKSQTEKAVKGQNYTISDGETLYAIAKAHGVTTEEILSANPDLDPTYYRSGQTIIIPVPATHHALSSGAKPIEKKQPTATPQPSQASATQVRNHSVIEEEPASATVEEQPASDFSASIAVILPFMLHEKTVSKSAARYTEFYKGLLLAVDTLKSSTHPTAIYAYDSAASLDTVRKILKKPELKTVQIIIAPPDESQMKIVADFGKANDIMVINPFLVKDESYRTNPYMMQASIPSRDLQTKAVKGMVSKYGSRTPVILKRTGAQQEHADFVDAVKNAYLDIDADPVIITYTDNLTAANLSRLNKMKDDFIFLPCDGKLDEIKRILPALVEYREGLSDPSRVMLMGYPEWITFRGDVRENMAKVNTVFYSRFFVDDEDYATKKASDQFVYWYGSAPEAAMPRQGFLGLDLGMYLIRSLRANNGDFNLSSNRFDGVQNGFHFVTAPDQEGWNNDIIYFINYRPSGLVDRIEF